MGENKVVFSFDTKGHEALRKVFQEIQKDTGSLSTETAKLSSKVSTDMNAMLQSFMKFSEAGKVLNSLRSDMKQFDQAVSETGQKMAQGFISGRMTDTFKEFQRNLGQVRAETIAMAREIERLEAQGKTPEARAKSVEYTSRLSQLHQMQATYDALRPAFQKEGGVVKVDADELARALAKVAGGGGGDGGGGGGDGGGGGGIFSRMFGQGGPFAGGNMSVGGILNYAARMDPRIAAAIALGGTALHLQQEAVDPASRRASIRESNYAAAEDALRGDLTRAYIRNDPNSGFNRFRRGGGGTLSELRAVGYYMYGGVANAVSAMTGGTIDESASDYTMRKMREGYEEADLANSKYRSQALNRFMRFSQENLDMSRMFGDDAVIGDIEEGNRVGITGANSRAVRQAIAMYQGRLGGFGARSLISAQRDYGITASLQTQIARSYRNTGAGVDDASAIIAGAGLGGLGDRYSAQVFSDYIARQKERMGAENSIMDIGAPAARLIPQVQSDVAKRAETAGVTAPPTIDVVNATLSAEERSRQGFATAGDIRNTMLVGKLMQMGFNARDARVLASSQNQDKNVKDIAALLTKRGKGPVSPEYVRSQLSAGTDSLAKLADQMGGISEDVMAAKGITGAGFLQTGDVDDIAKSFAADRALRAGYGGGKGAIDPSGRMAKSQQTAADELQAGNAAVEAMTKQIAGGLDTVVITLREQTKDIVAAITSEKVDRKNQDNLPGGTRLPGPVTRTR